MTSPEVTGQVLIQLGFEPRPDSRGQVPSAMPGLWQVLQLLAETCGDLKGEERALYFLSKVELQEEEPSRKPRQSPSARWSQGLEATWGR